ncbi:MAG: putative response-associated peptidase [Herminiimonas sp.]|nr:putative response-associated peptidase [Herminiimonas sp.]
MVEQDLKSLARRFNAQVDYLEFGDLFRRRADGEAITMGKALEANFYVPESDTEKQIKAHIDRYQEQVGSKLETALFAQKKRLADAERTLATKETKKALGDKRIASNKIDWHLKKLAGLKRTDLKASDSRIFPFWYAPLIVMEDGQRVIKPMRYHCRPNGKPASYDKRFDGLYNARRDSLDKFWKELFGVRHGLLVVTSFFENVSRHAFEKRQLAADEKPENIVLHFNPRTGQEMLLACLWDRWSDNGHPDLYSFAAITDEPPEEVAAAGHDRCVIPLSESNVDAWLNPAGASLTEMYRLLDDRSEPYYQHQLAAVGF